MKSVDLMSLCTFVKSVHLWVLWAKECPSMSKRMSLHEQKNVPLWAKECSSVRERNVLRESEDAKHSNRNCKDISVTTPFSVRGKANLDARRGPSAFKNMPFLRVKDALLDARRVSSLMLCVIDWFVVGYKVGCWKYYTPVLKMITLILCNDFS